jgi:DNA polymerase-3 subunit delta'
MSTAPWISAQTQALLAQPGHAWLLHGPSGLGQYDLALSMARAWLCDNPQVHGACQQCQSCHAIDVHAHADLHVLLPETHALALGWPLGEKAQAELDDKKRKPSKEIRIEAMRDAVEFSQRSNARGRGKVVLIFPAERMNTITANALLKTLEEPPGDVRFVLATQAGHQLLPTIRSRCLGHTMVWPTWEQGIAWLGEQGVALADAPVWLKAAGGRPDDALAAAKSGRPAQSWSRFPAAMSKGEVLAVSDWPAAELLHALQRLCHDLMAVQQAAEPRFFDLADLPRVRKMAPLAGWARELMLAARTVEHPFNPGLMTEALVSRAKIVLHSAS